MKERISNPGMPPLFIDVVGREVHRQSPTYTSETIWIRGESPHLGKVINGYTGRETRVQREYYQYKDIWHVNIKK